MKRIYLFLAAALLMAPATLRAQDAATEERLNQLSAQIQDLIVARDAQNKRLDELTKAIRDLQNQQNIPSTNCATQDDLKLLAGKLQEIDQKRVQDNQVLVKSIEDIRKAVAALARPAYVPLPSTDNRSSAPSDNPHYEYVIQSGDTLSAIIAAYKDKGIRLTLDQILKANPGLDPKRMSVGQKIIIPAPK